MCVCGGGGGGGKGWMPLVSVITDFIILCLLGQFIPYSLLLQELDIKNLRELEVNAHIHVQCNTTRVVHIMLA